jgi:hypothetical protein
LKLKSSVSSLRCATQPAFTFATCATATHCHRIRFQSVPCAALRRAVCPNHAYDCNRSSRLKRFELGALNRRKISTGRLRDVRACTMSDEFDSPDASERDASEKDAKRPSDDVVQPAPVKCRYTQSGICANIAGFCLCRQANFALPSRSTSRRRP